jgi:ankyrin repeat protein
LQGAKFKVLLTSLETDECSDSSDESQESIDEMGINNNGEYSLVQELNKDTSTKSPLFAVWNFIQWIDVSEPIRRLVAKGSDVNSRDNFGRTCLHIAVEEQSVSAVRVLLQMGADANLKDVCNATPLWHAVYWNKESMIKELLFANVELECSAREDAFRIGLPWFDNPIQENTDCAQRSTMYIAVKKNFAHTVQLLLEAGYKLERENMDELTAQAKEDTKDLIIHYSSQPKTLFSITRSLIRRWTGRYIHKLLEDIELPLRVKDCLLLRDLVDLKIEPDFVNK